MLSREKTIDSINDIKEYFEIKFQELPYVNKINLRINPKNDDYISFRTHTNIGEELFEDGKKFKIKSIIENNIHLTENIKINLDDYHKNLTIDNKISHVPHCRLFHNPVQE